MHIIQHMINSQEIIHSRTTGITGLFKKLKQGLLREFY